MLEGVFTRVLRAVFGGGSDISAANPLETHDPGMLDDKGINRSYDIDTFWYKQGGGKPSDIYIGGVLTGPGIIYTNLAYKHPIISASLIWGSTPAGTVKLYGFENGSTSRAGFWFFEVIGNAGGGDLCASAGFGEYWSLAAIAPADWKTAYHRYTIVKFPGGAEFWIDSVLKAVAVCLPGLASDGTIINGVLWQSVPITASQSNLSDYLQGMLAVEDGPGTINVDGNEIQISSSDGILDRYYYILNKTPLAASTTTALTDCGFIPVLGRKVSITVRCTYNGAAVAGLRVHVRSSFNNSWWDDTDLYTFDNDFLAGATRTKTVQIKPTARLLKVLVENLDTAQVITNIYVMATVGD